MYIVEVIYRNKRRFEKLFDAIEEALSFELSMNLRAEVLEANIFDGITGEALS